MAEVIGNPPEAPMTSRTLAVRESTTTAGAIEESGRLRGRMKFAEFGGRPDILVDSGTEKVFISSFKIIPVCSDTNPAPKLPTFQLFKLYFYKKERRVIKRPFMIYSLVVDGSSDRNGHSVIVQDGNVRSPVILWLVGDGTVEFRVVRCHEIADPVTGPFRHLV